MDLNKIVYSFFLAIILYFGILNIITFESNQTQRKINHIIKTNQEKEKLADLSVNREQDFINSISIFAKDNGYKIIRMERDSKCLTIHLSGLTSIEKIRGLVKIKNISSLEYAQENNLVKVALEYDRATY